MPYEVLQYVLGRALTDPVFHTALLRSPETALAAVAMSNEERTVVMKTSFRSLQALAKRIDRWVEHAAQGSPPPARTGSIYDGFEEFADLSSGTGVPQSPVVELLKSA